MRENPNWDLLSDADLLAHSEGRFDDMSTTALRYVNGEEIGAWESFTSNASRAMQGSIQTLAGLISDNPATKQAVQQKESEARIAAETNPVAGFVGQAVGALGDVVTIPALALKPLTIAGSAFKTGALRGAASGSIYGALNPVFEEFGDSRMANVAMGATLGGALGSGTALLLKKFGIDISAKDPQSPEYAEELKQKMLALPNDKKEQLLLEWNGELAPEPQKLLGFDGSVTRAEDAAFTVPTKPTEWNNQLKSLETVEEVASDVDLTLPPQVKKAVKINKIDAEFNNDIDHAFWLAGENKGDASKAAQAWLMDKTGIGLREVQQLARQVRGELARRVGQVTPTNGKIKIEQPSVWSATLIPKIAPPRIIRTPVQPKRIDVKDGLDPDDLEKLKLTGVNISQDGKGGVQFRDAFNGNKFMSASVLKERMNAVGIDLDVPGYRQQVRATNAIPQEELAKVAEEAPVIQEAIAAKQAESVSRTGRGEKIRIPKAQEVVDELDIPPDDIGLPKQQRSVGSAGVDPKAYLTPELMPKAMKDYNKSFPVAEKLLLRMLENDDPRVAIPKEIEKSVRGKGSLQALKQAGAKKLRQLIEKHGSMADFMLERKGLAQNMTADEVAAFRWFYADAMANKTRLIDDLKEYGSQNESFDTPEVARMMRDLIYYSGIDLFYKNDGTKASRAMNARRIISQTIRDGQTPQTKMMRGIFPGMSCQ